MAERIRPDQSVEVLLFDLGGVVIDIDFGRCLSRWATSAGCDVGMLTSRFRFDTAYEEHERGRLDAGGYFEALRKCLAVDLADDVLAEGWNDIYVGVNVEMLELLARARTKLPLYAFTNSNPTHQAVWSTRFATELGLFTTTFVSSDIGQRKPDAAAYDAVVSRIGSSPGKVLFFDDSAENVVGALEAGLQAVHVTSTESVRTALAQLGVPVGERD